jgi:hypothetical protein
MPSTYVNDAGTWRKLRNVYVNDAGTWRTIRKAYANDSGTWRTVFQRSDERTITAGINDNGTLSRSGFSSVSPVIGSISNATLDDGKTVTQVMTTYVIADDTSTLTLKIAGFSSDPSVSYLYALEVVGLISELLATSSFYSYSSGTATWSWNLGGGSAGIFTNGAGYTIYVSRS